jgi:hypothetical protein
LRTGKEDAQAKDVLDLISSVRKESTASERSQIL